MALWAVGFVFLVFACLASGNVFFACYWFEMLRVNTVSVTTKMV